MLSFLRFLLPALMLCTAALSAADVVLSVGASSPVGHIVTYTWSLVSKPVGAADPAINQVGPTPTTGITDTAIATFSDRAPAGAYTFRVTVRDGTMSVASDALVTVMKSQTIIFGALSAKTLQDADFTPGAVASSALAVTYTSSNTAVATILNGKIHLVGSGTATITASQTGNATFAAATPVQQILTVGAGQPPVISIAASATPATLVLP